MTMFRFMRKISDTIVLAIPLLRAVERFKDSPDFHERLVAEIRLLEQRYDRMAWLRVNRSASAEKTEGLAVHGH
jgi:hypothetical protein